VKFERVYWHPAGKPRQIGWRWRWRRTARWHYWLPDRRLK